MIHWSDPAERDPSGLSRERDADCIAELLHVHVWPDVAGVNVRPHGNTIALGRWPAQLTNTGQRVTPGPFFEWRVRRAIRNLTRYVDGIHARHAVIETTFQKVAAQ